MKQFNLFEQYFREKKQDRYSSKIEAPIYEPKNVKPNLMSLYNKEKTYQSLQEIKNTNLPVKEKEFLICAAQRHIVFNYELIADYYSHASPEMQNLMEKSGLVIIDFDKAIEYGYVQLSNSIREQYLQQKYEK